VVYHSEPGRKLVVKRRNIGLPLAMCLGAMAQQATMLEEMVKAGKLPPLAERLPANPAVVEPLNEVGKYGGTLNPHIPDGLAGMA